MKRASSHQANDEKMGEEEEGATVRMLPGSMEN